MPLRASETIRRFDGCTQLAIAAQGVKARHFIERGHDLGGRGVEELRTMVRVEMEVNPDGFLPSRACR